MIQELSLPQRFRGQMQGLSSCEHRAVSKEGRIVCQKIVEGDNGVSPNVCRDCPFKAIRCANLRFSLRQYTPSPLVVRFNGRTEVWDDDTPQVLFEQAACAAKVAPIHHPKQCAGCALRQAIQSPAAASQLSTRPQRKAAAVGKVVAFPKREPAAAVG